MRVISLTTGKLVPGQARAMEKTMNMSILCSHNLLIFER